MCVGVDEVLESEVCSYAGSCYVAGCSVGFVHVCFYFLGDVGVFVLCHVACGHAVFGSGGVCADYVFDGCEVVVVDF